MLCFTASTKRFRIRFQRSSVEPPATHPYARERDGALIKAYARERGATLIEAVLFTVIALGLMAGGIAFFQQASVSARANETVRAIASLQSQVRALHRTQSGFGTSSMTDLLIKSNAVPSSMRSDSDSDGTDDSIVNAFGGAVTVTGAGQQFTAAFASLPVEVCSRITAFDSSGNGVVGSGIASLSDGTATDSNGLSASEAATFCAKNASSGEVTITWTFDK